MAKIDLYHGSSRILEHPFLGGGRANNDYGPGLYCTLIPDLAKEWACSEKSGGFANHYRLETEGLRTLELNSEDYHILNWLAILLENRTYDLTNPLAIQAKKYILEHFLPRYHSYDLITGYRADDSYFSFSRAFLSNTISLEQLRRAMRLGKLGEQFVLRSREAFRRIEFIEAIPSDHTEFYPKKVERDLAARNDFSAISKEENPADAIYMIDIIRQKWTNDDPRI